MRYVFVGLVLAVILVSGTGCLRRNYSRVDTILVHKVDTFIPKIDSSKIKKVRTEIETVFVEVEKECPNLAKNQPKKDSLRKRIEKACTHESLGGFEGFTPDRLGHFIVKYDNNQPTIIWDRYEPTIKIQTKIVKESKFKTILTGIICAIIFFCVGFVVGKVI